MSFTDSEVLQFVAENGVKFIRLAFCDAFGTLKNIAIMADELPRAFECGVPFDAGLVRGFAGSTPADMVLHPDASTLEVLPWRPQTGRVARFYCSITDSAGRPFAQDSRLLLRNAAERAAQKGFTFRFGAKCEFYLFRLDENGDPTTVPHDRAGFLDVAPLDRGENVRRDICLTLEEMGIRPVSSHHEMGPGQNEIAIEAYDPLTAADHCVTFRNLVGTIAARNGLSAHMGPKPLPSWDGSGFHISLSASRDGRSLFLPDENGVLPTEGQSFLAGVLHHIPAMTLLLNSSAASYERLGNHDALKDVGWSGIGRGQLVRLPMPRGNSARMELRSPDNLCNPYLAYALVMAAGLDGIEKGMALCAPERPTGISLPDTLQQAAVLASESPFLKTVLPEGTLRAYLAMGLR